MNEDFKNTKLKIEALILKKEKINTELKIIVAEYMMRKLDIKKIDAMTFCYKKIIREEFNLVL